MSQNNIGEGVFIRLTEEEAQELYGCLIELKYEETATGVKDFLFDAIRGELEEKEKGPNPFVQAVKDNPEAVQKTVASFFRVVSGLGRGS